MLMSPAVVCSRPSQVRRGRSPRPRSYSPRDRQAPYRSHPPRDDRPYPPPAYEGPPYSPPPRDPGRPADSAWSQPLHPAPRRDLDPGRAPLRAQIPWDAHEYKRRYDPSSSSAPPVGYAYDEPEYRPPLYRQTSARQAGYEPHPEADYRQPLYPAGREPHREAAYGRPLARDPEPYARPQPAREILRMPDLQDDFFAPQQPLMHHQADDRWHDAQLDRQPLLPGERSHRPAPGYHPEDLHYLDSLDSKGSLAEAPLHARDNPHLAARYGQDPAERPFRHDLHAAPRVHLEDARSLHRYPTRPAASLRYPEEPRYPDEPRQAPRFAEEPRQAPRFAEEPRPAPRPADEPVHRYSDATHQPSGPPEEPRHAARYMDRHRVSHTEQQRPHADRAVGSSRRHEELAGGSERRERPDSRELARSSLLIRSVLKTCLYATAAYADTVVHSMLSMQRGNVYWTVVSRTCARPVPVKAFTLLSFHHAQASNSDIILTRCAVLQAPLRLHFYSCDKTAECCFCSPCLPDRQATARQPCTPFLSRPSQPQSAHGGFTLCQGITG